MYQRFRGVIPLVSVMTAVVLLAGCMTVGPDYERPQTALPEAWNGGVSASETAPGLAEWWRVFDDPLLENLMV